MPTILIVADEPEMVRRLDGNLRFEGYRTLSASNGADGLALALREGPRVAARPLFRRAYRAACPLSDALEVLRREAGKPFDPRVAEAALALPEERWAQLLDCPAAPAGSHADGLQSLRP